jgi:hypothetical protein
MPDFCLNILGQILENSSEHIAQTRIWPRHLLSGVLFTHGYAGSKSAQGFCQHSHSLIDSRRVEASEIMTERRHHDIRRGMGTPESPYQKVLTSLPPRVMTRKESWQCKHEYNYNYLLHKYHKNFE